MRRFAETAETLSTTRSRLAKVKALSGYLSSLSDSDLRAASIFFTGRPFPLSLVVDGEVVAALMRNGETGDFASLRQSYTRTLGEIPDVTAAAFMIRKFIDADDAMAVGALKVLKVSDKSADLFLESSNHIEDEARSAAPGSAPFLTATSVAANLQSQAMMQKMRAALIRQEATRIAEENRRRKGYGLLVNKAQQRVSDFVIEREVLCD